MYMSLNSHLLIIVVIIMNNWSFNEGVYILGYYIYIQDINSLIKIVLLSLGILNNI